MKTIIKILVLFLFLSAGTWVLVNWWGIELGPENYWDHHGILLLIGLTLVPRLTLLLSNIASGGVLWWVAWLFVPRLLVAGLATLAYWQSNPALVIAAWLCAIGGESGEKYIVRRRVYRQVHRPITQSPIKDVNAPP